MSARQLFDTVGLTDEVCREILKGWAIIAAAILIFSVYFWLAV